MQRVRKLRDAAETVLRGKFLVQMLTLEKKSQISNLSFHLKLEKKEQYKPKSCKKEEINVVFIIPLLSCVLLFAKPWTTARQAPLPPLSPGVCSSSCPLSRWCCLIISPSVTPFSSCPQSFPALRSFLWVAKVLELQLLSTTPVNIQG